MHDHLSREEKSNLEVDSLTIYLLVSSSTTLPAKRIYYFLLSNQSLYINKQVKEMHCSSNFKYIFY